MTHTKQYPHNGNGVELHCNGKLISSAVNRESNFMLDECPECGMEIYTSGISPETDKVLDYERKR